MRESIRRQGTAIHIAAVIAVPSYRKPGDVSSVPRSNLITGAQSGVFRYIIMVDGVERAREIGKTLDGGCAGLHVSGGCAIGGHSNQDGGLGS
jgi:hypothetical protein